MSRQLTSGVRPGCALARQAALGALLLGVGLARADELRIENVKVLPRGEATAAIPFEFDIAWSSSWRYGSFHDAAWVCFKVRADAKADWQPVRLAADRVLNPTGYGLAKGGLPDAKDPEPAGTPLEFVVPAGGDLATGAAGGDVGMIVRRATDGFGSVAARRVRAVWDLKASVNPRPAAREPQEKAGAAPEAKVEAGDATFDVRQVEIRGFGIEMVLIPEGPFYVGRGNGESAPFAGKGYGGMELNWLYKHSGKPQDTAAPLPFKFNIGDLYTWGVGTTKADTPAYRIENAGAIPTGRQKGSLWAVDITPADGGEIPAAFPNGYAAFYCMKWPYPKAGQYADFLNTLTAAQAKPRYYAGGHGAAIKRTGQAPNYTYTAANPDDPCPWVSFTDGAVFAAWAGLRPMTELEYEKICRGPQAAIPNDTTPSYWGVQGVMTLGIYERPISIGSAVGRAFKGTHGRGTPELPTDWPPDLRGAIMRSDYFFGGDHQPAHLLTAGRVPVVYSSADRVGINMGSGCRTYAGWRGARSVPAGDTGVEPVTGAPNLESVRVPRLKPAFRPDGNLDEWAGLEPAVSLSSPAYIFPVYRRFPGEHCADPWGGAGDFSARTWLGWDGAALCVAAEVRDNVHVNGQTGDQVWNGDAMQLGLVNAAGDQWNIGAALAAKGPAFYQLDGPSDALTKTAGYAVVRDEAAKVTRYELRLPLADIGVKPGEECSFYLIFSDDDNGKGWYRRLQYLPSKTKPFMRRLYPKFVLVE